MLTQVPEALRTAARQMVLRHPNAIDCMVMRRSVSRTEGAAAGGIVGGIPTLGGLAVLDPEEEAELDWENLGNGKVVFTGVYEGSTLADNRESAEPATTEALFEPLEAGAFEPKDGDLIMCMPGLGAVITYEVSRVHNRIAIPPYVPRYELSPQGDLLSVPGVVR